MRTSGRAGSASAAARAIELAAVLAVGLAMTAGRAQGREEAEVETPELLRAVRPGVEVSVGGWSYARTVWIPIETEGVARVPLHPEDVACSRTDLGDVRVVDAEGRQWPYLLRPDAVMEHVALRIESAGREGPESVYRLAPAGPLGAGRLLIATRVPYFDREFVVTGKSRDGPTVPLARGRLARLPGETDDIEIELEDSGFARRADSLRFDLFELRVRDGEDAPIVFERAEARVRLPVLLVVAPAGRYTLLLGNPLATLPHYEAAALLGRGPPTEPVPAAVGELRPNPEFHWWARMLGAPGRLLMWAAILVAVVLLGGIVLRMAAREGGRAESAGGGSGGRGRGDGDTGDSARPDDVGA